MTTSSEGCRFGYEWAKTMRANWMAMRTEGGDMVDPVAVVDDTGQARGDVRNLMQKASQDEGWGIDFTPAFWTAFVDGVRQHVAAETQFGMGAN